LDERMPGYALGPAALDDAAKRAIVRAMLAGGANWRLASVDVPLVFTAGGITVRAVATRAGAGWAVRGDVNATFDDVQSGALLETTRDARGGTVVAGGRTLRWEYLAPPSAAAEHAAHGSGSGEVTAPMPGKIISVVVEPGATVEPRALLVVLEAMKMEHRIEAPLAGTVRDVRVTPGQLVASGATLVIIGPEAD
jgi:biotin carboxyl carrier protein